MLLLAHSVCMSILPPYRSREHKITQLQFKMSNGRCCKTGPINALCGGATGYVPPCWSPEWWEKLRNSYPGDSSTAVKIFGDHIREFIEYDTMCLDFRRRLRVPVCEARQNSLCTYQLYAQQQTDGDSSECLIPSGLIPLYVQEAQNRLFGGEKLCYICVHTSVLTSSSNADSLPSQIGRHP